MSSLISDIGPKELLTLIDFCKADVNNTNLPALGK